MEKEKPITTLFLDVGGVLLCDGWDRYARKAGAKLFHLDHNEMEERHHLNFETYELGKMSLDEYLNSVVFYSKRHFTREEFKAFIYKQSRSQPEMIELVINLKKIYALKIAVISNEGRELNEYRIKKFKLTRFIDFFISSSFVNLRKPDAAIFRLALDIAQVSPEEIVFIDNQALFVSIAERFGMRGIYHTDLQSTKGQLSAFGLVSNPVSDD